MSPETPALQATFRALADPTRRQIIGMLSQQPMTVAQVAGEFDMTRAAVKKHLIVLEEGAIVASHAEGRERINQLQPAALKSAADWLDHFSSFWDDRLAALKTAVETDQSRDQTP